MIDFGKTKIKTNVVCSWNHTSWASVPNNKKMEIDSYARQPLSSWPLIKNLETLKKSGINTILSWYFTKAFNLLDLNIWRIFQIYDWYYN